MNARAKKSCSLLTVLLAAVCLSLAPAASAKAARPSFPFNSLIADEELAQLQAGEIVIRNIKDKKNMCMTRGICAYADELLKRTEETLTQAIDSVRRSRTSFRNASGIEEF